MNPNQPRSFLTIPSAIIVAGSLIAISIIWVFKPNNAPAAQNGAAAAAAAEAINLAPITSADHILGNPDAPIVIVEYSDPSCPFCKIFHPTMEQVMAQYGAGGKVAWVYRAFPLDKPDQNGDVLHPNAGHESQALECAAFLGGNDKFWAFTNRLYDVTPSVTPQSPTGLDQKQLPVIAKYVGLDPLAFNDCLTSGQFASKIEAQYTSGINAGVQGTPTSFITLKNPMNKSVENFISNALIQYKVSPSVLYISGDKKIIAMGGAMPQALITGLLDALLQK